MDSVVVDEHGNDYLSYLKRLILLLVSPSCYNTFFVHHNFLHTECLKSTLSTGLGLGIVAGSVLVKVPQILKIFANKSGAGISIIGQLLELYAVIAYISYSFVKGFPFSTWGEGIFIAIQTSVVIGLTMFFGILKKFSLLFVTLLLIIVYILMSGLTPVDVLWMMQAVSVPIMFLGKMVQAYSNFTCKSMGQQSIITCFLLVAGSLVRIFTSVQQTGDSIIIITYSLASLANAIIFLQFFIYKPTTSKVPVRPSRKKKRE